jgi:hypothetical protein
LLSEYKQIVWKDQIQNVLNESKATLAELENIKGRLTHLACVDGAARHFLGRINHMVTKLNRQKVNQTRQKFRLPQEVIKDFQLMLKCIDRAQAGISMNHSSIKALTSTSDPTLASSDLVGYAGAAAKPTYSKSQPIDGSPNPKTSWSFSAAAVPLSENTLRLGRTHASVLQTDNTNAEGWLYKTNFYDDPEKIGLARWLAEHQIKHKYCLYSQWFAGKTNIVSVSLSRDHHLSDTELTYCLLSQYPEQLPKNFRICPVSSGAEARRVTECRSVLSINWYRTGRTILCPVRAWAAIVQSIKNLPGSTKNTPVCSLFQPATQPTPDNPGKFVQVTGKEMTTLIRKAVADMGTERLGFKPEECGTHSIRSAAAMAMHMAGVPVYTIMLIGRWSSDAFLVYLRTQVMQFTQHISVRMTKHSDFYNVPCFNPTVDRNDKHQTTRSHPLTTVPTSSNGGGSNRLVPRNPFNLFIS